MNPEPAKAPAPPAVESPAPKEPIAEDAGPTPPDVAAKVEPAPPPQPLWKKLAAASPSANDVSFVLALMDRFKAGRPDLLKGAYEPVEKALRSAPDGDGEYQTLHREAAIQLVGRARAALRVRFAELGQVKSAVSLALADGGVISGRLERAEADAIVLRDERGAISTLRTDLLARGALAPENAPLEALLAYQSLSWKPAEALAGVLAASQTQDELVPWVPIVVRLARLEIRSHAEAAVREARPILAQARQVDESTRALRGYVAAAAAAKAALSKESEAAALYGFLGSEFAEVRREIESLDFLLAGRYSRVLAGFQGTAAHALAGELLLDGARRELDASHDELLARTGFVDYQWRLDPPGRNVEETTKYWDLDNVTGGTTLQAGGVLKRLLMQEGHERAPEGVVFRARFEARTGNGQSSHWRLYLRTGTGSESYLRGDGLRVEVYRTRLAAGAPDELLARGDLGPPPQDGFREYALVRGDEQLHFFVDGQVVVTVHAADAVIPRALSFGVEQGVLRIATVKVRKSK